MKTMQIFNIKAVNRETKNEFSLGAYSKWETAYKHKQIMNEVCGEKYLHYIEETTLFLEEE